MRLYFLALILFFFAPSAHADLFGDFLQKLKKIQQTELAPSYQKKCDCEEPANGNPAKYVEIDAPIATENSCFNVSGRVDASATALLISVSKGTVGGFKNSQNIIWPVISENNGRREFNSIVCLKEGPGDYTLTATISQAKPDANGQYTLATPYQNIKIENRDARSFSQYLSPSTNIQSIDQEVIDLARAITVNARDPVEKAKAIYAWVARNVQYDVASISSALSKESKDYYLNKPHDAKTILKTRIAVCQGYSYLAAALLRASGVPVRVVTGSASANEEIKWTPSRLQDPVYGHAWNEVFLNGKWEPMDITWGAGTVDENNIFYYEFNERNFGDSEYFQKTHVRKVILEE